MKYQTKRIPLDSIKLIDLTRSGEDEEDIGSLSGSDAAIFPALELSYSFSGETLPGYGPALPATEIEFMVPADDMPRVKAWFSGDYHNVTLPASETLKKNMTAAVHSVLSAYYSNVSSHNLLGAPFRIGWRYRLFDGSTRRVKDPELLIPASTAPVIEIVDYSFGEKSLHTDVVLNTLPARLRLNVAAPSLQPDLAEAITAIEIFMTQPTALYDPKCSVNGIRSVTLDESRIRTWHFDSYDAATIDANAVADEDFRVVTSIPYALFSQGLTGYEPLSMAGLLNRFSSLPSVREGSGDDSSIPGDGWRPYLHFETEPISLGYPDSDKRVREVMLRGLFERDKVRFTLHGARHRDRWIRIASGGPYLRGIAGASFPWYKLEVETTMRKSDFIDAITFGISPIK